MSASEIVRRFYASYFADKRRDQQIVVMRHFEKLSLAEVAGRLATSAHAAIMRYLHAMRRIPHLPGR